MNAILLNYIPANLRAGLIALLWIAMAAVTRNLLPWFFWLTVAAIPALAIVKIIQASFDRTTLRFLFRTTLIVFAVHLIWSMIRSYYYDPTMPTYWNDDFHYFLETKSIVEAWKTGFYPDISLKGSLPYLGTLHTGYHRILSAVYYITGIHVFTGLALNAICASMMPLLSALTAFHIVGSKPGPQDKQQRKIITVTATLAALHPTQFYWAAYLLKDTFTAFVFFVTLVLVLHSIKKRDLLAVVAAVILLPFLFSVRAYTSLSIIAGCLCLLLLRISTRLVVQWGLVFCGLIFVFFTYTFTGNRVWEQVRDSFVGLLPPSANGPGSLLLHCIAGIPRLFLSPYAWMFVDKPSPMYGMYPGMIYLYLLIYPLGFAGLSYVVSRNIRISIVPLMVFGFAALLFLASNFGGAASRQRYYLEYLMIPFAAIGLAYPNKWWIRGILMAELAFAIGQIISLY